MAFDRGGKMSYPKKVLTVRPTGGLAIDLPASEIPPEFWTGGNNMQFRDGFAQQVGGYQPVYDGLSGGVKGLINTQHLGENYWLYFGNDTVHAVSTDTHSDISPILAGTTKANQWTLSVLNGVPVACNGIDAPIYWGLDPAVPMATLDGWPVGTVAGGIRAHRYNLFAYNIQSSTGTYPDQLLWSNSAEPGAIPTSWTPLATNDSGDTILSDTQGSIIEAEPLRSSMIFYKQGSCYAADYVGGNNVYDFRKLFATAGTLSKNCVAEYNGMHYILADGDVIISDGNTASSLIDGRMRNFIFNQLDSTNHEAAFVAKYTAKDEIWICIPSSGNDFCDIALVIDTGTGKSLGIRDLPNISCAATGLINDQAESQKWDDQPTTWNSYTTKWNQQSFVESEDALVLGKPDDVDETLSKLYQVDAGNSFDGDTIQSNIERTYLSFEDPTRIKFVRRVTPHISGVDGAEIKFRIGSSMTSGGSITWSDEDVFVIGSTEYIDTLCQGRFISFSFSSSGQEQWQVSSFDVEADLKGYS